MINLTGVGGGSSEVSIRDGLNNNEIVIVQGEKVVAFNLEDNCVEQTWYAGTGKKIRCAVSACGLWLESKVLIVVDEKVVVWGEREKKVETCRQLDLKKNIKELMVFDNKHWVIFEDGSVELLKYFTDTDSEEWINTKSVVNQSKILQSEMIQSPSHIIISHLLHDETTSNLLLVKGKVVNTETHTHDVIGIETFTVCPMAKIASQELYRGMVTLVKRNGTLSVFHPESGTDDILTLPSADQCGLVNVSKDQVAVMGSLAEGGFLQLINTTYRAVVVDSKVKNTSHKGKGIFFSEGRLFLAINSKIMSVSLGENLHGGLDMLLGKLAIPQTQISYYTIPNLIKNNETEKLENALNNMQDIPEELLLDCIAYFLSCQLPEADVERCLCAVFKQKISNAVMSTRVSELELPHVVKLCSVLDKLLNSEEDIKCEQESLLEWLSLLITSHYLQLVVSRDNNTLALLQKMVETVKSCQDTSKELIDSKVLVHNIVNTKVPPVKNNNQDYCIEIIQI